MDQHESPTNKLESKGARWKPKQSAHIARLVPNPAEPPNVTLLSGYIGDSTRKGYVRLYLGLGLNEFVDVPEDAIHHGETLGAEAGATLSRTAVWVDKQAQLQHTRTVSRQVQADFLQGDLTSAFLGGTAGQGLAGLVGGLQNLMGAAGATPEARATRGTFCISVATITIVTLTVATVTTSGTVIVTATAV